MHLVKLSVMPRNGSGVVCDSPGLFPGPFVPLSHFCNFPPWRYVARGCYPIMVMYGVAVLDRGWGLHGSLEQWRRITGVTRAELASSPLTRWVHPDYAIPLLRLVEMAEHGAWTERLRVGRCDCRALVEAELGPWAPSGMAPLTLRAVEPPPIRAWWLPRDSFAELAACPTVVKA